MLTINGSSGEGGGQILRSSLALSMVTGTPFQIQNIRANRGKPGLMRQHLTCVRAAASVCNAALEGDEMGSQCLTFIPGDVAPGAYTFSVGTAGSTMLVLQTVLPALLTASGASEVSLEGGTHNPFAPPFEFLQQAFLPLVDRMGPTFDAALERPGFYPAGGGRFTIGIEPTEQLKGFDLMDRGTLRQRSATAVVVKLPRHIAERELKVIKDKLNWRDDCLHIAEVADSLSPGNIVIIELQYDHVTEVFCAFGKIGRSAEAVAQDAVQQCRNYLKCDAPVGEYLTDQLLLPLAIAGGGRFRSTGLSLHSTTHIELIGKFLTIDVQIEEQGEKAGTVVSLSN